MLVTSSSRIPNFLDALSSEYSSVFASSARHLLDLHNSTEVTLEPYEMEITEYSTPWAIVLATPRRCMGLSGVHFIEQKQMFGREASKYLDYIECSHDVVGKGRKMTLEFTALGLKESIPTWTNNSVHEITASLQVLSGEQNLQQALSVASEFLQTNFSAI